jgi:hypothetical protein
MRVSNFLDRIVLHTPYVVDPTHTVGMQEPCAHTLERAGIMRAGKGGFLDSLAVLPGQRE